MQFSTKILLLATVMLVAGAAFPFLMISKFIPTTFWLSILSYIASVAGLLLGMYGIAAMTTTRRKKDDWEDWRGL